MNRLQKLWCLTTLAATSTFFLAGFHDVSVSATNTPQALPFTQNWTNTGLITANDDWSGVPGVVGFLGDYDVAAPTAVDPRTLLTPFVTNNIDVIANQNNVALTNGGVAEFDGIANPVVALNGSGTADAPHIIIYLNTTGLGNIQFTCNIRDIDDTADNSIQQVDVQYRVGGTGSYTSVPGGYIFDASSGPSTTMTTPLNLSLPAGANNQSQLEIRVMTTNASGNDEWIGVDDISVTGSPAVTSDAALDFNGDGKTDYAVVHNVGAGQWRWFYNINGSGPTLALDWGLVGDLLVMEDFDGDGKDDVTAYRQETGTNSAFYILQSQTSTLRLDRFGVIGDDASVVGDYDGDGKADTAVYRAGAAPGAQSTWYYRGSLTPGNITFFAWGVNGDKVAPGDYDGDGKNDFVIARDTGANKLFWTRLATGAISSQFFGQAGDSIVPGDYDGDAKTDLAVLHNPGAGTLSWFIQPSSGGSFQEIRWGNALPQDTTAQGDYDGDGKTDVAIWRASTGTFWSRNSTNGGIQGFALGSATDQAVAGFNKH